MSWFWVRVLSIGILCVGCGCECGCDLLLSKVVVQPGVGVTAACVLLTSWPGIAHVEAERTASQSRAYRSLAEYRCVHGGGAGPVP